MANAIDVISWKAKQMGISYGALRARMKPGDAEAFAKAYEQAKKEEWDKLCMAAEQRRRPKGDA